MPAAHGEGKFLMSRPQDLELLEAAGQVVLRYVDEAGEPTQAYPANPNGSPRAVAGLCDPTGRVFGLMPHPEHAVEDLTGPGTDGLGFFTSLLTAVGVATAPA